WTVARKYRDCSTAPRFPGAARILAEFTSPPPQRRVGLRPLGRVPVRAGAELHTAAGVKVGRVTSGGYGASVDAPIAMGYVARELAVAGTRLVAPVREREEAIEVTALPFVPHRYHES
ncbi:MAG: glycine cleavage T C-terminal barrel domain-containing protein, partial [Gammaproteobacteria bacterium]